jgi:hypothetical protein
MALVLGTKCGHVHQREHLSESGNRPIPPKFCAASTGMSLTSRNVMEPSLIQSSDKDAPRPTYSFVTIDTG